MMRELETITSALCFNGGTSKCQGIKNKLKFAPNICRRAKYQPAARRPRMDGSGGGATKSTGGDATARRVYG